MQDSHLRKGGKSTGFAPVRLGVGQTGLKVVEDPKEREYMKPLVGVSLYRIINSHMP